MQNFRINYHVGSWILRVTFTAQRAGFILVFFFFFFERKRKKLWGEKGILCRTYFGHMHAHRHHRREHIAIYETSRSGLVRVLRKSASEDGGNMERASVILCVLIDLPFGGLPDDGRCRSRCSESERDMKCQSAAYATILVRSYFRITARFFLTVRDFKNTCEANYLIQSGVILVTHVGYFKLLRALEFFLFY